MYKEKIISEIRVRITDPEMALQMNNYQHINWSEFCRLAIKFYIENNPMPLNALFKDFKPSKESMQFESQ